MKILFFSSEFPGPHDPYRAVFNRDLVAVLGSTHEVRVVCPVPWTDAVRSFSGPRVPLPQPDAPVHYMTYGFPPRLGLSYRGDFLWWSTRVRLGRLTRTWRPDLIVAYWTHPDGEVAARLAGRIGVPFAQIVGGSDVLRLTAGRRGRRIQNVLTRANAVGAIGEALARHVMRLGVDERKVVTLRRCADPTHFYPGNRDAARAALRIPLNARVVLWVGRFHPIKGLPVLVDALDRLRHGLDDDVRAYLIGMGAERQHYADLIHARGLGQWVSVLPAVSREALGDWYRAADITVLPSLSEGLPNVLLESIACGTPFVASDVGAVREISDDVLDRVVPPGDDVALQSAIRDSLTRRPVSRVRAQLPSRAQFANTLARLLHVAESNAARSADGKLS